MDRDWCLLTLRNHESPSPSLQHPKKETGKKNYLIQVFLFFSHQFSLHTKTHLFISSLTSPSSLNFHSFISPSQLENTHTEKMCINISDWNTHSHHNLLYKAKKSKVQVHRLRLNRRNRRLNRGVRFLVKTEKIEKKNLKLYLKNRIIVEENEKLRKKALFLGQENQALMYQLQKKFSQSP